MPQEPTQQPWVVIEGATIRLNPDARYWFDVAEFERLSRAPETLAQAVELYRGDLLENVSDEWVVQEREHYRGTFLTALAQLVREKRSARSFAEAIAYAERILVHDSLREDAARELMAVRYEAGDRAGALRAFEQFAEHLREELDVDPMPETVTLHEAIVRNAAIAGVSQSQSAAQGDDGRVSVTLPFVGRETELEQLRSWWSRAARGRGQALLIGGEAGIGKTRLASELALLAQAQGARVLAGTTAFAEAAPYQAIAEAIRSAMPLVAALDVEPITLAALSRIVPELQTRRPDLPALAPLEIDAERIRLFDAIAGSLGALATPRPVLLMLEDLHWAGTATAAAFEFLARRCPQHPLLIVATYREEETSRVHPLRDVRRRLQQEKLLVHMSLARLRREAVEQLVAHVPALSGQGQNLGQRLYDESEGNPFFAGEVIRDMLEIEAASPDSSPPPESHVSAGVRAIVAARIARLTTQARSLAEVAAVVGRAFDVELLREVSRWEEGEVLDTLSELLDRHLVREIGGRANVDYAFTHHLIQSVMYAAMSDDNRKQRHRRIAVVMEELYAAKTDELAAELALHWDRGAQPGRAAVYYMKAAARALDVFAVDEAHAHLNRGIELATDDALRADLHTLRAEVRRRRGDTAGQREDLDALDLLARSRGDEELICEVLRRRILLARVLGERGLESQLVGELKSRAENNGSPRWQAKALQHEATFFALVGRYDEGIEAAQRAADLHGQLDDTTGRLECICLLAETAARRADVKLTRELLREARRCAEQLPNPSLIGRATVAAARAANIRQDFSEALELGRAALELYQTACDRGGEADAWHCMGVASIGVRNFDAARRYDERATEIFRSIGNRRGVANVLMDSAVVASALGDLADAEACILKATALFEVAAEMPGITLCALYLSDFRRNAGDVTGAKQAATKALQLARTIKMKWMEATALGNLGDAERDGGELTSSLEHLEAAAAMMRKLHRRIDLVELLVGLSLSHLAAGDGGSARKIADELLADEASMRSAHRPQYGYWAAAQAYRAVGDTARSDELLRQAHCIVAETVAAIADPKARAAYLAQPFNQQIQEAASRDSWPSKSA